MFIHLFVIFTMFRPMHPSSSFSTRNFEANPLFNPQRVDCSNSVNDIQIQLLSYWKEFFVIFTFSSDWTYRWFRLEAFFNKTPLSIMPSVLPDNIEYILETYKSNVFLNRWSTTYYYYILLLCDYLLWFRGANGVTVIVVWNGRRCPWCNGYRRRNWTRVFV